MLLPPNELSIVEAYICGDVNIDGSMEAASKLSEDIEDGLFTARGPRLVGLVLVFPETQMMISPQSGSRRARKLGPRHTPVRDAAAIHYHYDVGNSFYKLWLDRRWFTRARTSALPGFT